MSHECTRDQYLLNFSADVTFRRRWCPRMTKCAIMSPPYLLHAVLKTVITWEALGLTVSVSAWRAIRRRVAPRQIENNSVILSPFLFYGEAFCYFQVAKLFQSWLYRLYYPQLVSCRIETWQIVYLSYKEPCLQYQMRTGTGPALVHIMSWPCYYLDKQPESRCTP